MSNEYYHPTYLEVREVDMKKNKRPRIFSWSFKLKSMKKNRYGSHYTSRFEVFLTGEDKNVRVKLEQGSTYIMERMTAEDFLACPVAQLFRKVDRSALVERVAGLTQKPYSVSLPYKDGLDGKSMGEITELGCEMHNVCKNEERIEEVV